jgi:lipoprotein signal peptidase
VADFDSPQQAPPQPSQVGITQNDLAHHLQELGILGSIFGSKENAPYYIAAIAILGALAILAFVVINQPQNAAAMTLLGAIITGSLGYIFGKSSS